MSVPVWRPRSFFCGLWALAVAGCAGLPDGSASSGEEARSDRSDRPSLAIPALELPPAPSIREGEADEESVPFVEIELRALEPARPAPGATVPGEAPSPLTSQRTADLLGLLPPPGVYDDAPALPDDGDAPEAGRSPADPGDLPPRVIQGTEPEPPATLRPAVSAFGPEEEGLQVGSILPRGPTDLAPWVTIVFSEPMVALGPDGTSEARDPPAFLDPEPEGRWRWIDVRTLRFEPDAGRLPGATAFTVRIPAGVGSITGERLATDLPHSFRTEGPRAIGGRPHDEVTGLEPLILLVFDQEIRAEAVLQAARLTSEAGEDQPLRRARDEELDEDPRYRLAAERAGEGRWVALRPSMPLLPGAEMRFELLEGLTSTEGPLPIGRRQVLSFTTRGAFRVQEAECADPASPCTAFGAWSTHLSNPLPEGFPGDLNPHELVRIEPEGTPFAVTGSGRQLRMHGDWQPFTTYRVELLPALRDRFGQPPMGETTLTAHFGAASPLLGIEGGPFLALDPTGPPVVHLASRALEQIEVEVFRVGVGDWSAYVRATERSGTRPFPAFEAPGERVAVERIVPEGREGHYARTPLELAGALPAGRGHAVLVARGRALDGTEVREQTAWVQASALGMHAQWDAASLSARVWSLEDLRPREGVEVWLAASGARSRTDDEGYASLALAAAPDTLLVARVGGDTALLPSAEQARGWGGWVRQPLGPRPLWHTVTDRGLYRPGEEARLHGWIRQRAPNGSEAMIAPPGVDEVRWEVRALRGGAIAEGTARVEADGWFHASIPLPPSAPTGRGTVRLTAVEGGREVETWSHVTELHLADFRRPEYEVRLDVDPGPYVAGESIEPRLMAGYFDGPRLSSAPVRWRVTPMHTSFTPPGWQGWRVGAAGPVRVTADARRASVRTLESRTDGFGVHRTRILAGAPDEPYPVRLTIEAEVQDLDHSAGSGAAEVLIHPAQVYAALRADRNWITVGDRLEVEVAIVDLEGSLVDGLAPTVTATPLAPGPSFLSWEPAGDPVELECRRGTRSTAAAAGRMLACDLEGAEPGRLLVEAEVRDGADSRSRSELQVRVYGPPTGPRAASERFGRAGLEVTPERTRYEPGDTVRFLVTTLRPEAEGTLTLVGAGIRSVTPFRVREGSATVAIPLGKEEAGGLRARVELTGSPDDRGRPEWGTASFLVSAERHRLAVEVRPDRNVAGPGEEVEVGVRVRDGDGRAAAGGRVTLWAVDEAVLERAGYRPGDPMTVFYERIAPSVYGRSGLQRNIAWERRPSPGTLSARLLDARSGAPARAVRARLEELDLDADISVDGELQVSGLEPGRYTLVVEWLNGEVLRRELAVGAEGLDLGLLLLDPAAGSDRAGAQLRLRARTSATMFRAFESSTLSLDSIGASLPLSGAEDGVAVRHDFAPLAAFEPDLEVDSEGRARARIRLPDTMTRYRIFAVATRGSTDFGMDEGVLTARRDLVLRAAPPPFLLPGDRSRIPVLVQNASDGDLEVEVVARASGIELERGEGVRVRIAAGERREVGLPARAGPSGQARLEVLAVAGEVTDAVASGIPIGSGLAPELVALHGEVTGPSMVRIPVELPADARSLPGELAVSASTSVLHRLADALWVLCREPVPWPEPTISRIMGVAPLADRLDELALDALPSSEELRAGLQADVTLLNRLMEPWIRGSGAPSGSASTSPALLTLGIEALLLAERAGIPMQPSMRSGLVRRLEGRLEEAAGADERPGGSDPAATFFAHTLYVAAALGVPEERWEAAALPWIAEIQLEDLPVEALAWLLVPLSERAEEHLAAEEILRILENRAVRTGSTATFRQGEVASAARAGQERVLMASHRRTDAVALAALLEARPDHALVTRLARGLLAHRDGTPAGSLYESAWGLMALGRYLEAREGEPSAIELRAWLAGRPLGSERFDGSDGGSAEWIVPLEAILEADDGSGIATELVLRTEGPGTLHYRAALRYATESAEAGPLDRGLVVSRRYEGVDGENDVRRDADGTWRIRAGARVRVHLTVTAPTRRHQVQLRDPVPAGLAVLNPELRGIGFTHDEDRAGGGILPAPLSVNLVTGTVPWWDAGSTDWTELVFRARIRAGLPWHTHREFRDDRMEAYAAFLPAGSFETSYLVRATAPGDYRAPPPRVEELDQPEVFGQGAAERVVVGRW